MEVTGYGEGITRIISNFLNKSIYKEVEANNNLCWITSGKEIENYLSKQFTEKYYNSKIKKEFGQYEKIDEYLDKYIGKGTGDIFKRSKVDFSKEVIKDMTLENMKTNLDLDKQMKKVIAEIERWNKD